MNARKQVVAGLVPPQVGEALIREEWPSVAAYPGPASLGRMLICSIVLAPLGWFLMLPIYFLKILPFVAKRYTLTNRRIMIRRGLKPEPTHEVALSDIEDVRVQQDANSEFFRSGDLEILSRGQVALKLLGVPEPQSFRLAIINAIKAWVPGRANAPIEPASAATAS
jgi:Bacterial PH domain